MNLNIARLVSSSPAKFGTSTTELRRIRAHWDYENAKIMTGVHADQSDTWYQNRCLFWLGCQNPGLSLNPRPFP